MHWMVKFMAGMAVIMMIGWFVSFQFDPYRWCEDHPSPDMTDHYYVCEPFGFELRKGVIDRPPEHRFPDENKRWSAPKKSAPREKYFNCQDPNTFLTDEGYKHCMEKIK